MPTLKKQAALKDKPSSIDVKWFRQRMADVGMSARQVSIRLAGGAADYNTMSRVLTGVRQLKPDECRELAEILAVPIGEILRRIGIESPIVAAGPSEITVSGWVDEQDAVHEGPALGPATVQGPPGFDAKALRALRVQGGRMDGWVLFFRPGNDIDPEAVSRACVCQVVGEEGLRVAWCHRGYEPGWWNLQPFGADKPVFSAQLRWAAPLLWMRQ